MARGPLDFVYPAYPIVTPLKKLAFAFSYNIRVGFEH